VRATKPADPLRGKVTAFLRAGKGGGQVFNHPSHGLILLIPDRLMAPLLGGGGPAEDEPDGAGRGHPQPPLARRPRPALWRRRGGCRVR